MVREHVAHAVAGAFAPHRDDDALARLLQRRDVLGDGLEDIAAGLGTLGCEITALFGGDINDGALPFGHREGRQPCERHRIKSRAPLVALQIEAVGWQWPIWGSREPLRQRLLTRLAIILD